MSFIGFSPRAVWTEEPPDRGRLIHCGMWGHEGAAEPRPSCPPNVVGTPTMTTSAFGIAPLAAGFRDGSDDPVRALDRALSAADRGKADLSILWRVPTALAEAEAARARFQAGRPISALDGIPVAVKDCMDVAGLPSTNGTKFLTEPMPVDAP